MYRKIVLPLVMIAAAALGCSQLRNSDTANSGNPATVANANNAVVSAPRNAVSPTGDPVAEINAMADKFLTQKSFRAKMTGKGDKDFSTDVAFAAPDRFLMKTGPEWKP